MTNALNFVVKSLAFNGQAFIEHNRKRYFLDKFVPGDKISVTFDSENNKIIQNIELVSPSSERVKADCFFYGNCGGCDWLAISEKARKKYKSSAIKDIVSLIRAENVKIHKFIGSKRITGYMPRVRLHQGRNYKERVAGFLAADNHEEKLTANIVLVKNCPILLKPLNSRLVAVRQMLSQMPVCLENLILMCSSAERADRVCAHATMLKGKSYKNYIKYFESFIKAVKLKGISIGDYAGKVKKVIGDVSLTGLVAPGVEGGPYFSEPNVFVQGNVFQNEVLVNKVVQFCGNVAGKRVVEGFAGAGNFTIALAKKGARVEAVESHFGAVRTAKKNIKKAECENSVNLIEGDANKELLNLKQEPEVLLLDPPRSGTKNIEKIVNYLSSKKIVYVFCELSAMKRDCEKILKSGYKLTEVVGLDMYPRTHRVEVICLFEKV